MAEVAWGLGSAGTVEAAGPPLTLTLRSFHLRLLPGMDSRLPGGKTQAARTLEASTPGCVAPATLFGQSTSQAGPDQRDGEGALALR